MVLMILAILTTMLLLFFYDDDDNDDDDDDNDNCGNAVSSVGCSGGDNYFITEDLYNNYN